MNRISKKILAGILSFLVFLSFFAGLDLKIAHAETYIIATLIDGKYEIDKNGCGYVGVGKTIQLRLQSSRTVTSAQNQQGTGAQESEPIVISNSEIRWRSTDESKATVDNTGKVTGVADTQNSVVKIIATYKGIDYERTIAVIYRHHTMKIYRQDDLYLSGEGTDSTYRYAASQDVIDGTRPVEPQHKDYERFVFSGWYQFNDSNNNNIADADELNLDEEHRIDFMDDESVVYNDISVCAVYTDVNLTQVSVEYVAMYEANKTIKLDNTYRIEAYIPAEEEYFEGDIPFPNFTTSQSEDTSNIVLDSDERQVYLKALEDDSISIQLDRAHQKAHIRLSGEQIASHKTLSFKVAFTGTQTTYRVRHLKEKIVAPGSLAQEPEFELLYEEVKPGIVYAYTDVQSISAKYPITPDNPQYVNAVNGFVADDIVNVELDGVQEKVIDIHYRRQSYKIEFHSTGDNPITSEVLQYEAPITVDTDDTSSQFGKITLHDVGGNIIEIQTPTRRGFKFLGWRFTFIDKGNEMEMNPAPNMMPGHDVIATPIWQINQKADYTIIFWKQKSVVSTAEMNKFPTDSTTYEQYIRNYNYDSSRKISQGADVDTQTSQLIAKHQNDGTFSNYINQSPDPKVSYQYKSAVASDERLRVDGSTVINVFYNRPVITYTVDWSGFSVPSDNSHRSSYTGLQGANIADYYPGFQFDTRYAWRYYESGTGYITNTLIDSFVSIEDGTAFEARTNSNTYNSKVIHFVENAEGNFEVKAEVNLSGSNNFDVTNKFDGYTAKGYRIIARRTNETISAYETRCRVPDVTSSGYRTTNMKNISVGNNRSIQVYHYRDVGYTLEMYAGTATRSDVMLAQYGSATSADIHYGDNVWSTLQKYLESQGVTVGDEPVVKPEKVQNDNTDSDTTNDWTWKGWYMVPNPQSDDTEGRLTQETAATFGDSKTVRIFAVWEAPQCTIRFHDLSNTNPVHELSYNKYSYVSPSDLYDGEQLTKPSIANTLEGTDAAFEFEGWYYDENFSAKYDTDREINRSFDLYARWLLKGRISYKVDIYNTKGEKIGTQTIMVSDAGTYETIGLEQIEGYENTGASKKIYVDADLIEAEVRAYIQDNVGVYQIHCIEDDDNMTEIRNVFLGTTYEEKYVLPPAIEGYMFTGYSRKVTTYDEGHLESKAYQVINKEQDCKSTGAGYLNTPEIIFHYKRIAGNPIEIHYFTENDLGTYTQREEDTIHLSGDAGETINYRNYQKLNEDGTTSSVDYARDDKYPGYYMAVANADLIKTVSSITSRNIVNVYYRRKFCKVEFVNRESNRSMRLTTSPNNPISKITESVKANDTVETPEVFAPVENTFYNQKYTATWYLDGTNTPFDFETPIDHDIVLYAVWGTSSNPWYTLNISGASDTVDYTASAHYITDRKSAISEVITGIKFTYNFSPNGLFAQPEFATCK